MAISLRTAGSWAFDSAGSITVALPAHQTGDMLLVRGAIKSGDIANCVASTASSGWAKIGQFANGTTNSGNGTGSVLVFAFWKIAASASEASPTIDFTQTNTQGGVVGMAYQKGASDPSWLDPVGDGGPDTTAGTSHSATIQTHVEVKTGDLVDFFTGICDDTVMTVPTITQTGVTFDAVTESPATAGTDTAGADGAYDGGFRSATAGTSSAAAVVTGTLSTSETGTSWMTRLRLGGQTSFTANAVIALAQSASITTDAVIKREQSASFSANAIASVLRSATFSADAVLRATVSSSYAADAIQLKTATAGYNADAVILTGRLDGYTADAVTLSPQGLTLSADAFIAEAALLTLTADAVILGEQVASISSDAITQVVQQAAVSADAVIEFSTAASFTTDAVLSPTPPPVLPLTVDAWIVDLHFDFIVMELSAQTIAATISMEATVVASSFSADAVIA